MKQIVCISIILFTRSRWNVNQFIFYLLQNIDKNLKILDIFFEVASLILAFKSGQKVIRYFLAALS